MQRSIQRTMDALGDTLDEHPEADPSWLKKLKQRKTQLKERKATLRAHGRKCKNLKAARKVLKEEHARVREQRETLNQARESVNDNDNMALVDRNVDCLESSKELKSVKKELKGVRNELERIANVLGEYRPRSLQNREILIEMCELCRTSSDPRHEKRPSVERTMYVTFDGWMDADHQYGQRGSGKRGQRAELDFDAVCRER